MIQFDKKITVTASFLGALTIAIGAFGAHGLEKLVDTEAIASFETGVRYQMYHTIALLVIGFATAIPVSTRKWVFRLFVAGIIFFSGSIYFLALKSVLPLSVSFLGPVTPIGGLLFILGWLRLAYGLLTNNKG
ncbi:MAG: DUF423 domain-containing protein [Bacteroidia bacterium]|nr:DUF423 domain-containing protein [Bacteroidia bacterium]MBT8275152.1 DUF423 domain-containing protein [Bacteroidia bacterium]NNJ82237.1 DUF423 domain-containing protein [Flavobacteriaceae bacterium]NNK54977.1 DUF423 domain-containing protein [Flavobacteriaceae bacterium]NNM10017.1 DUF423 domain-containing protein [Flavobacteriaceae bacterium]